tara:strand:+ start:906 stop:1541 length:636 start_codon:yes stop_codon:yes gene_type:complete
MAVAKLKCKCGCGKYQLREKVVKKPFGNFYNETHAGNFAVAKFKRDTAKKIAKAKQVRTKEIKVNRKSVVELNRKTIKWQHKQTQPRFNLLRRLQELKWFSDRGLEPVCTSCRKPLGNDQWCNGHFKSVGANGRLRYDFKNSYLQHNYNCNQQKSGDASNYEKGLIERFGEKEGCEIIHYCEENNKPLKLSWQEIEELRIKFNKQIKELEK